MAFINNPPTTSNLVYTAISTAAYVAPDSPGSLLCEVLDYNLGNGAITSSHPPVTMNTAIGSANCFAVAANTYLFSNGYLSIPAAGSPTIDTFLGVANSIWLQTGVDHNKAFMLPQWPLNSRYWLNQFYQRNIGGVMVGPIVTMVGGQTGGGALSSGKIGQGQTSANCCYATLPYPAPAGAA